MPDRVGASQPGALLASLDEEPAEFEPSRFDLSVESDRSGLRELFSGSRPPLTKCDRLSAQVRELLKNRNPGIAAPALDAAVQRFLEERGRETYGSWVYYPWRRMLVRVLPKEEFVELRTSRNRYKITPEEQVRLGRATVGIVGLSAGHAMAVCLALERVCARFRLADFDAIELSNMNRVASGITTIGVNKAVLATRALYEIDPYLDVVPFIEGITETNLEAFLDGKDTPLDLLIEECDDLYMKVRLREEAKARKIPVIMETNDRGVLDLERFDLEPSRPVFHGLLDGASSGELRGLDVRAKTPFVLRIFASELSERVAVSLIEIDRTITGWPQLASGNMLGAAIVTHVARRVLLGQIRASGRTAVSLDDLITDSTLETPRLEEPPAPSPSDAALEPIPRPVVVSGAEPSRAEMEWLVRLAAMAPSGGNDQPWRFVWRRGREVDAYLDRSHSESFLDFECAASYLALGAALENAEIASTGLGRATNVSVLPVASEPDLVWRLSLGEHEAGVPESPLLPFIAARVTNRRLGERKPLDPSHARTLGEAARERGAELTLVTDPARLVELGELLGAVDRFRFLCEPLQTAMMGELRWTAEEVSKGDGIDVATLELDTVAMAGLRLLSNPKAAAFLRSLGVGEGLESSAKRSIAAASAVGLIAIDGMDARAYVQAGRAVQNVWLRATRLGLAFQPMSAAPYLFARLTRGAGEGFSGDEVARLGELHEKFSRIFPSTQNRAHAMVFRLAHAPEPTARARRRPLHAIFTEA